MTESNNLAAGTYEVLRNRLRDAAGDLRERLTRLNASRAEVFGNIETSLVATERVNTEHNCVPRDIVSVGDQFLFGYNVQFGLKTDIQLSDVFAAYQFSENQFHSQPLTLLGDEQFSKDFTELYRFYKNTRFARFFRSGPMLHMVFQVGKTTNDLKSFKWRIGSDAIEYIDNRSEHEVRDPPQHEFRWNKTTRDQHHYGAHPHISIEDLVFVETVGGDLTIKIENNTETGEGIYAEPVENPDQQLDDAEIHYSIVGNLVLLRIRPYQESDYRYVIYNGKIQQAMRLDDIEHACVMLPSDHGLIFPGGYYLQTGEFKRFDHGLSDMRYQRTIAAPNGEDYLYLFYNPESGTYVQLRYNLIRQTVDAPLICHGQTFFEGGEMVCFRGQDDPQKHHAIQIWQTPFTGSEYISDNQTDSYLFKIGNKEIVGGMAECNELIQLIDKDDSYEGLYVDLVRKTTDLLDSYFWIDHQETEKLSEPIAKIREAASAAVEEFEKVVRLRRDTGERIREVKKTIEELLKSIERNRFESIGDFVSSLAELREQRGHAIGLRELKYADETVITQLEEQTAEKADRLSRRCVEFLLTPNALAPYQQTVQDISERITEITSVSDAKKLQESIEQCGTDLELLTETVSNLKIEDTKKRTGIIDSIGDVFASLNRVRSALKARTSELASDEGQAEFASQLKLLEQTTSGYLDVCDSPQRCDEYLTKLMVQLEELEGRFAEFDDFVIQLAQRREEVYAAFESRKVSLIEKRNRRAESLSAAADRILKGIDSRVGKMESTDEIASYFASDLMVDKVRDIMSQLEELEDAVRVEDLQSRLKTIREDATRQLKDRQELYEDGGDLIRLGKHRFAVNTQPLDLTTVLRDGEICLHLTGTQFFDVLKNDDLEEARDLWNQEIVSENRFVYRAEYLAYELFQKSTQQGSKATAGTDTDLNWVQSEMAGRFEEGYAKGVHDIDTQKIVSALLSIHAEIGILRYPPSLRAAGNLWFYHLLDSKSRKSMTDWIGGFSKLAQAYPQATPAIEFREKLAELAQEGSEQWREIFEDNFDQHALADYLFDHLIRVPSRVAISQQAANLYADFKGAIPESDQEKLLNKVLQSESDPRRAFILARNWIDAYLNHKSEESAEDPALGYRDELAWLVFSGGAKAAKPSDVTITQVLTEMAGNHARIERGEMKLHFHEFMERMQQFKTHDVPRFQNLHRSKTELVETAREEMRLSEFKPRVLTSFVRNRLLDEVYLPLIGDNLAKQMGASGDQKRTDRMGLLLLISPPGYGKTTLMEYVANRLGIVFMKINGPAIGHAVTSLDPAEAPNAAAREEVERLNLALEMGDNVMIYVDDIQHTHPEFLQKFISLCDATRKIEGVRNGKTRTFDLRGRRVAVVMAGNPYTESGDRFQVPDMLSNRADVYNLGEIIGESAEAFEMSYLENCLTSNASLAPLATASPQDARAIIQAAERDSLEGIELQSRFSMDQVREMFEVMRKLLRVRDVVLKVNRAYIRSAAQADHYRTEPPFKLQGSYRNMNRIAERVASVMNESELQSLIISTYEQDAQTLTTDNEANVLKFKEILGVISAEEKERWDAIKYAFVENVRMAGLDSSDQAGQLMRQLASMRDGLESIRQVISKAIVTKNEGAEERMDTRVEQLKQGINRTADQLTDSLNATSQELARIAAQQATDPPQQKVLVQHKVPRVLADLVKGQFHLMQEWLRPILSESLDNGRDLEKLQTQLESMMQNYTEVEQSFSKGRKKPTPSPPQSTDEK